MTRKVKSREEILEGKAEGIRYMCVEHFWVHPNKPCPKCLATLGIDVPDRKIVEPDLDSPKGLMDLYKSTKLS